MDTGTYYDEEGALVRLRVEEFGGQRYLILDGIDHLGRAFRLLLNQEGREKLEGILKREFEH